MAFDLVTWAPRVGASADDAYNIPGATKLDGSVDSGAPTRMKAGSSAGFSTTPTIAEINASSDLNQVYGLANRRIRNYNTQFGTALGTLTYVAAEARITATHITTARTRINALRVAEGFDNYNFTADVAVGKPMKGDAIAELRKALGIAGIQKIIVPSSSLVNGFRRTDNPYNTLVSESLGNVTSLIGKARLSPTNLRRERILISWRIPDWFDPAEVVTAETRAAINSIDQTMEAFNVVLYASNTDDHTYSSVTVAYNLNTLVYSGAPVAGDLSMPMDLAVLDARKGSYLSMIYGTDNETANAGGGGSGTQKSGYQLFLHSLDAPLSLVAPPIIIDWG